MKVRRKVSQAFKGKNILVSAGPTRERWDAVRCLTNYSSGRMGYALAAAAKKMGARVTLVSGPVGLAAPAGVKLVRVESTREMKRSIESAWAKTDLLLMAAAPADFRPVACHRDKLKKDNLPALKLVRNPDILASLGRRKEGRYLVGFAAESTALLARARGKLKAKGLDCIAGNLVGGKNSSMGGKVTSLVLLFADGRRIKLAAGAKATVAKRLLAEIGRDLETRQG
jgi:phosphopantothenoylcysteine decarboxylase/phosphopantothenate--cysteine ligase